jgi:hypothetical protein
MKPFKPPNNTMEVKKYLLDYLEEVKSDTVKFYKDKEWVQIFGFKRAFYIHGVYICKTTNEHAFHVDEQDWFSGTEPNIGVYESFDSMIDGVSKRYAERWGLKG